MTQSVAGWLPQLLGPVVLQVGAVAQPARANVNFAGATASDDGTTLTITPSGIPTTLGPDGTSNANITSPKTTWGTAATSQIVSLIPLAPVATAGATLTTVLTFPIPADTVVDFSITIVGKRTGGVSGTAGDSYRADFPVCYQRIASAAPSLVGAAAVETGKKSNGGGSAYVGSVAISGNNLLVQVTGVATTNIDWTAVVQGQQVG